MLLKRALRVAYHRLRHVDRTLVRPRWQVWRARRQSTAHGRQLTAIAPRAVGRGILCMVLVTPATERFLPAFLRHHRSAGVGHFLLLCQEPSEKTRETIADAPDCSGWTLPPTVQPWHAANYLLHRHARNRWVAFAAANQFLTYAHADSRRLDELADFLASENKESMTAVILDMYGEGEAAESNPLAAMPWFDATGYHQSVDHYSGEVTIIGGASLRCAATPQQAPALNRIALVRWRQGLYLLSWQRLSEPTLNRPHFPDSIAPTGCLLQFAGLPAPQELGRGGSTQLRSWTQLVDLGLMNVGRWF